MDLYFYDSIPNGNLMNTMNEHFDTENYFEEIGAWPHSMRSIGLAYVIGFVLSALLTITAYVLTVRGVLPTSTTLIVIVILACVQFAAQILYFLHLSTEPDSRERLVALCFATLVVAIVVGGSLWIISSLNERMMPSTMQMEQYMNDQTGI